MREMTNLAKTLSLNERLAVLRFSYVCHRTAGLKWIGRNLSRGMMFQWTRLASCITRRIYPADRRRARHMRQVLGATIRPMELRKKIDRNILYRKWLKQLVYGWPNWGGHYSDWALIDGEEHLQAALTTGKGAILLSGHAYGFSKLVAPILGRMSYKVHKTAGSMRDNRVRQWGEEPVDVSAIYIDYGNDYWPHLRALQQISHALESNHVVHMLIRGFPRGEARLAIDFCYKGFFLDPLLLRTIEILGAPVLPLFAICDSRGCLRFEIYPPVSPHTEAVVREFGPLYARYLRESPEFSRIWRGVAQQKEGW